MVDTVTLPRGATGLHANLQHIMRHECKPDPKPLPGTAVTRGFEACAYPKIVRELGDAQLVVRQKALLAAQELLGNATGHIQCIAAGITPATVKLLQDEDALVRERAAAVLEFIACKDVGARDVIQHGGITQLVVRLTDSQPAVRAAAYLALIEAGRCDVVRQALCEQKALPHLLTLALSPSASGDTLLRGLLVLNACAQARHSEVACWQLVDTAKAIPQLVELLIDKKPKAVQAQAAWLIAALTAGAMEAKITAVHVGAVPRLLALLGPVSEHVTLAASAALMNITVARAGKYAVVDVAGGLAAVVALLAAPQHVQLCMNAMEVITNVAEAPEARPLLEQLGTVDRLNAIYNGVHTQTLKDRAVQALRQCGFKHLPYQALQGRPLPLYADEE